MMKYDGDWWSLTMGYWWKLVTHDGMEAWVGINAVESDVEARAALIQALYKNLYGIP